MKNKSGKGHVEAVLSFVIFLSFLLFLFTIFNPFSPQSSADLVQSTFLAIDEKVGVEVSAISLAVDNDNSGTGCFSVSDFQETAQDLKCSGNKVIVKNQVGDNIGYSANLPNSLSINYLAGNKIYTIICSEEIISQASGISGCPQLTEGSGYSLGVISNKRVWSETNLTAFQNRYNSDYETLRDEIVRQGNDFSFKIWNVDDLSGAPVYQGIREPSFGTRVDARTISIDIIDTNGIIQKHTINIAVW